MLSQEEADVPMNVNKSSIYQLFHATDNLYSEDSDANHQSPLGYGMEHLDSLDENLHAESRARKIGFIGMSSQVRWLQTVAEARTQQLGLQSLVAENHISVSPRTQMSSFCYWADGGNHDQNKSGSKSILNTEIQPYRLPPFETAQELLTNYMLDVHGSFPILSYENFERQFHKYYAALQQGDPPKLSSKWLAILNLVFAISTIKRFRSKHASHIDDQSHHIFHMRARALHLDSAHLHGTLDVPQTQGYGLLAFYYLCVGWINQ